MRNLSSYSSKKHLFFAFIVFLLTQSLLFAQSETKFGIKAGFNFSNFYGKDAEGDQNTPAFESKTNMAIGIFANMPLNNTFSLQPELLYSNKGAENREEEQGESVTASFKLSYIDFIVPGKIAFPLQNMISLYLLAGPELSIKTKSNFELNVNGEKIKEKNLDEYTKAFDFGLLFGVGFAFNVGQGKLLFEGRYNLGLLRIYKEDNGEELDMKNKAISLMLGYEF